VGINKDEDTLQDTFIISNPFKGADKYERFKEVVIDFSASVFQKRKMDTAILFFENTAEIYTGKIDEGDWMGFISSLAADYDLSDYWGKVLDLLKLSNGTRLFFALDRGASAKSHEKGDSVEIYYAESGGNTETYIIPYERKFLKGKVFGEIHRDDTIKIPHFKEIMEYWGNE
jgi:hypothetical protein